jgi:hypothetical protein
MELARQDIYFLRSLCRALLALAFSAVVLVALLITGHQFREPNAGTVPVSTIVLGKQFKTVLGTTQLQENALLVTGLQAQEDGEHALITTRLALTAQHYPYLQYKFDGLQAGLQLHLFWSTAENQGEMFSALMPRNFGDLSTFHLAVQPGWEGTITDIGIYVSGDLRGQPLKISEITLSPSSGRLFMASVWSEWAAFRGWTIRSINFLHGAPGSQTISPTIAMALWAGLASLFLYVMDHFWPTANLIDYGVAVLIPWMTLDQFWQSELSTQLQETKHLFSGKTTHEKHLVDVDWDIYRYTKRLKEDVLPSSPSRIFILHDSQAHDFQRLKTQYYLLPHNIFNFNRWASHQQLEPGDYILVLGAVPGVSFDTSTNQFHWANNTFTVAIVDQDPFGILFQVPLTANLLVHPDLQQEGSNG